MGIIGEKEMQAQDADEIAGACSRFSVTAVARIKCKTPTRTTSEEVALSRWTIKIGKTLGIGLPPPPPPGEIQATTTICHESATVVYPQSHEN
jgi:hypothetical protein